MNTLDDYRDWLATEGYTPSTVDASLKVLRRLDLKKPKPTSVDTFLLRRYLRYVKETRKHPLGKDFTQCLEKIGLAPATTRALSGVRKRKLLTLKEFHDLKDRCLKSEDSITALVGFYMISGKKPREFLQQLTKYVSTPDFFQFKRDVLLYKNLSPSLTWAYRLLLAAARREGRVLDIDVDLGTLYRSRLVLR